MSHDWGTGNLLSSEDAHGHTWHYTYNNLGRVTSATDPKSNRTDFIYAANNVDLVSISNGLGQVRAGYNASHDLLWVTDPLGNRTSMGYNAFGQILVITNAAGTREDYIYNRRPPPDAGALGWATDRDLHLRRHQPGANLHGCDGIDAHLRLQQP